MLHFDGTYVVDRLARIFRKTGVVINKSVHMKILDGEVNIFYYVRVK